MKRVWTIEEKRAAAKRLADGKQAAKKERDRNRIMRVKVYEAWLRAGSDVRDIPEIPSDDDYAHARTKGIALRTAKR